MTRVATKTRYGSSPRQQTHADDPANLVAVGVEGVFKTRVTPSLGHLSIDCTCERVLTCWYQCHMHETGVPTVIFAPIKRDI